MLKDTHLFENLNEVLADNNQISSLLLKSLQKTPLTNITQDSRCLYQRKQIVGWMLLMKFLQIKSFNEALGGHWKSIIGIGKDVLYKVKNNELINWRKILLDQAWQIQPTSATKVYSS